MMTSLEEFETILKDVVQAKRLSVSKMNKLTEIALKSMKEDTSLVSILYRTHKSLRPTAKISSLYVFDALARAARSQVNKHGLTMDSNSGKGNSATFLLKVEGVLEGLFQDMVSLDGSEPKDKTRKILDIWVKGNTFPPSILSRLKDIVDGVNKERELSISVVPTTDPRESVPPLVAPKPPVTQTPNVADPQATLLALLTQAASAMQPSQTPVNTPAAPLDPQQLVLLQQLTQSVKSQNGSSPIPTPVSSQGHKNVMVINGPSGSERSSHDEAYNGSTRTLPGPDRYDDTESSQYDRHPRDNYSSSGRGTPFRGGYHSRGRGDGRGRWDDRDRFREKDRSPPRRPRRSRSRSPPSRYNGRRDVKPYSPPRRPTLTPLTTSKPSDLTRADTFGKDEFGRDIRSQSPARPSSTSTQDTPHQLPLEVSSNTPSVDPTPSLTNNNQFSAPSSLAGVGTAETLVSADESNSVQPQLGMTQFNFAAFDPSSPASWEALGKWWEAANGYAPNTEELMQWALGNGALNPMAMAQQAWPTSTWQPTSSTKHNVWRGGQGRGGYSRGRGGYEHGNPRGVQAQWNETTSTDAIVLGGGADKDEAHPTGVAQGQEQQRTSITNAVGQGGKMQRVGDKWVFVRGDGVAVDS